MKKVLVIGAGPGGYPAALKAAELGAEVTVVEKGPLGGVCLNCGCIPSKSLLHSAHKFHDAAHIDITAAPPAPLTPDWEKITQKRINTIVKLRGGIDSLFKMRKIKLIKGTASFINEKEVEVNENGVIQNITFDDCIIAAGSQAFYPPNLTQYKEQLYDNTNIFDIHYIPKRISIIGGGVIGCEFACMFNALGTEVNIIEMQPTLVPGEEDGMIRTLTQSFTKRGIKIYTSRSASDITFTGGAKMITLDDGSTVTSDEVLVAVGRTVDLTELHPEKAGIEYTRKGIKVNPETLEVKPGIYAVGDVNGLCMLAHAAHRQGETAAGRIMGLDKKYNNDIIPRAMYTHPEVASVGLNKKQAEEKGLKVKVKKSFLMANGRALAQEQSEGFSQVVIEEGSGKILGMQLCGAYASELIQVAALALSAGMTAEQFEQAVFAHPTVAENIMDAMHK